MRLWLLIENMWGNLFMDRSNFTNEVNFLIDLLLSPEWPEAVPSFMICGDSEKDKAERAEGILNFISEDLDNKKFCDFGCGEGHVVREVSKSSLFSVGYDISSTGCLSWEKTEDNFLLTTNFDKIRENGPFDIILLYDVLDHVEFPDLVLQNVFTLCSEKTKVFVRCHPWMSRHGGHLYSYINKAWVHLVFTEQELNQMGYCLPFLQKIYYPLGSYNSWFENNKFKIIKQDTIKCGIEQFFHGKSIKNRLPLEKFNGNFPESQMSQCYDDFILGLKK